ncbi:MAG: caspase family protein [Thermosynechococcaceae cyanobacterium MS004]|nr:caspase family protein [Thermosynechococcaceae cyanobacterium MS004]
MLTSTNLPQAIQQSFMQGVVHHYWQNQAIAGQKLRAAYLYQLSPNQTLFGWMYCRPAPQEPEDWITHFLCYYSAHNLDGLQLDGIFNSLETGPATPFETLESTSVLEAIALPLSGEYPALEAGVKIPSSVRARSRLLLYQEKLLHFFLLIPETDAVPQSAAAETPETLPAPLTLSDAPAAATLSPPEMAPSLGLAGLRRPLDPTVVDSSLSAPTQINLSSLKQPLAQPAQKAALLIGVSESELGVQALSGVSQDIESLKAVLEHPDLGAFDTVTTLLNADSQQMAEEIEQFFSTCPPNGLALLYFSGHAIWDSQGMLCLTTKASRRGAQHKVVRSTVVSADFLAAVLQDTVVQHPVVLLDCCLSEDGIPRDSARKNRLQQFRQQLTASGTTVVMSSTAIHHVGVQKGHRLSAYTAYLIEGLATGIADTNGDGVLSLEEWHSYATRKVQLSSPALRPRLYRAGQFPWIIAQIDKTPLLQYRREVERCVRNGQIPLVNQLILEKSQKSLALAAADCIRIKAEVLKPYQEYQQKLRQYATAFLNQMQTNQMQANRIQASRTQTTAEHSLVGRAVATIQDVLGLTDADTAPIRAEVLQQLTVVQAPLSKTFVPTSGLMPLGHGGGVQAWLRDRPRVQAAIAQTTLWVALVPPALSRILASAGLVSRWGQSLLHRLPLQLTASWTQGRQRLSAASAKASQRVLGLSRPSTDIADHANKPVRVTPIAVILGISVGALLLTAAIFEARRQQEKKRALAQLETFLQQREYDQCIAYAQPLPNRVESSPETQQLVARCEAGLFWKNVEASVLSPTAGKVQALAFGEENRLLASAEESGTIQLWDLSQKTLARTLKGHQDRIWSLGASADGTLLASGGGDKTVKLWRFSTGQLLRTLEGHESTVWSIGFVPNRPLVASGSEDGTVRVWNTATGQLVRSLVGDKSAVRAIALSTDGQTLASGSVNGAITLWNLEDGQRLRTLKGHTDRVTTLATSRDDLLASGSADQTIRVWRLRDGTLVRTVPSPALPQPSSSGSGATGKSPIRSLAFSPLDQTLGSAAGTTVELQKADAGQPFNQFSDPSSGVNAIRFSSDGKILAIARQNNVLSLLRR